MEEEFLKRVCRIERVGFDEAGRGSGRGVSGRGSGRRGSLPVSFPRLYVGGSKWRATTKHTTLAVRANMYG
jgi:hypothetical protein